MRSRGPAGRHSGRRDQGAHDGDPIAAARSIFMRSSAMVSARALEFFGFTAPVGAASGFQMQAGALAQAGLRPVFGRARRVERVLKEIASSFLLDAVVE